MSINFLRFTKISLKLTIIYAFLFSLVLILLNAAILYGVKYFLDDQAFQQVENTSNIMIDKLKDSDNEQKEPLDKEFVQEIQFNENVDINIADKNGEIINSSEDYNIGMPITTPLDRTQKIEAGENHLVFRNSKVILNNGETIYLQVVKDMENEYGFMKILFLLMIMADAIGIILSLFIGFIISRRVLKPIDNITKTAQSISIHDLNSRIEVKGPDDELTRLARTFNEMIDRLQSSFERQSQFVSDASHELRTPISIIQGYINLMDRWGKKDREVLQESIDAIKNETSNMTELIEKLLFLAKGESGTQKLIKEEFWLNELINEVLKESRILAPDRDIFSNQNDSQRIYADRRLLKQMLRALIDNSIKFTSESGKIEINAIHDGDHAKIMISDNGIGIPQEEIPLIFNRFYRVDKSRVRSTGGSGLGLSIVKWIVNNHGGRISVNSAPEKGTNIMIILPLK
ncbi:ATP-binding protein [Microaerobacter geothermalis]|uniref:sensor histidine kinase n=1 Tax=Microaerobacter geothermalis TaxID=674972 RepID=UPI001F451A48|nr:ATP-binding protein [Microaerobacter geothermalis]MCF6095273.1 ATP-binding protein [Microaerobacter geothermalis]